MTRLIRPVSRTVHSSLELVRKSVFGFIWLGLKSLKERGVDRIKRSVLKNYHSEGGLNITDIDCLNRSLKLRQFLRAIKSRHPICNIQKFCFEKLGYLNQLMQEYARIPRPFPYSYIPL